MRSIIHVVIHLFLRAGKLLLKTVVTFHSKRKLFLSALIIIFSTLIEKNRDHLCLIRMSSVIHAVIHLSPRAGKLLLKTIVTFHSQRKLFLSALITIFSFSCLEIKNFRRQKNPGAAVYTQMS